MNQKQETTILIAISFAATSDETLRKLIVRLLEGSGYTVISAQSPEHAVDLMNSYEIDGIVMTSDWATFLSETHAPSLIEIAKEAIPTLTIVLHHNHHIYDQVYFPNKNEYMRLPLDTNQFWSRLKNVLKTFEQKSNEIKRC